MAGELTTTNYGWVKPTVGASVDAWGGYINTDLDGIDTTVKGVSNVANAAAPLASPAFTGTPSMPTGTTGVTQTAGDNSTKLATTAFVSALPVAMNDNRIINGDMRINQRGVTSGTAISVVMVDRWNYFATQAAKGTWGQGSGTGAVIGSLGFPYFLSFASSSAYTPLTTDYFAFSQPIEADLISDFAWGTANAQSVTLSFWAYSNQTGTFGGTITNYVSTRCYPFTYSIPGASTWTKIAVTIPGDTAGTWVISGNGGALYVQFDLGSGALRRGPAGAWATTTSPGYIGANGSVSVVATLNATFYVTGVKLEIGNVATPYNRQSLAKSIADCQRYYAVKTGLSMLAYQLAGNAFGCSVALPVTMRAPPTVVLVNPTYTNASGLATANISGDSVFLYASVTASGTGQWSSSITASAEL